MSSRLASMSSFSANGSPTWTDGRLDGSSWVNVALARTRGPADPVAAGRRAEQDDEVARARRRGQRQPALLHQADGHDVDERVALVGRVEHELAADRRDADAVAVPADAADDAVDEVPRPRVGRRRRSAARRGRAIGRAPIVKMSRRMPPTPVAAPWYGSTADGWLCDSILKATARPSPIEMTPGVLAGPGDDPFARRSGASAAAAASSCTSSARST